MSIRKTYTLVLSGTCFLALAAAAFGACPPEVEAPAKADASPSWESRTAYIDATLQLNAAEPPTERLDTAYIDAIRSYEAINAGSYVDALGVYSDRLLLNQDATDLFEARRALGYATAVTADDDAIGIWVKVADDCELQQLMLNNEPIDRECIAFDPKIQQWIVSGRGGEDLFSFRLLAEPKCVRDLLLTTAEKPNVRIGITMEDVPAPLVAQLDIEPERAIMIADVVDDLAAARAGVRKYDVVTRVDDVDAVSQDVIREVVQSKKPGEKVRLQIIRNGRTEVFEVDVEPYAVHASVEDLEVANKELLSTSLSYLVATQAGEDRQPKWTLVNPVEATLGTRARSFTAQHNALLAVTGELARPGLTLQVTPRIVNDRIVLDTHPLQAYRFNASAQQEPDAKELLRQQIAELKAQLQRLEELIETMNDD